MHGTLGTTRHAQLADTTSWTPWVPGVSKPEDHPLWQEQVELELEMVERGAEKYRERVFKARKKQEMSGVDAYRFKIEEAVPLMIPVLKDWIAAQVRGRGRPSPVVDYLRHIDPGVACFICVRTVFDCVTAGNLNFTFVAKRIGMEVEYQARMDAWMKAAPDLYFGVQNSISKHATSRHIRRVNINRFNALMKDKLQWQAWTDEAKMHIGFRLVDVASKATRLFEVTPDVSQCKKHGGGHEFPASGKKTAKDIKPNYTVHIAPPVFEALLKREIDDASRHPQYLPTLMPPKRWEGIFEGAYYTPVVRVPSLVRFHAEGEDQRQAALEEYGNIDMPRVMSALHYVQETPWRVNKRVLEVALSMWSRDLGMAAFPKQALQDLPTKPTTFDADTKIVAEYEPQLLAVPVAEYEGGKWKKGAQPIRKPREELFASFSAPIRDAFERVKAWKKAAARVYGDNATRASKVEIIRTTFEIAEKFINREFYFPHMLDFRGRMYPIATYLQPQGNDLARGLLTFAKGQPVGENGGWLAIHLANHFGADKLSYDDRIKWVEEREQMWRDIVSDPLGHHHLWLPATGRKHHWQGLAAVFEWVRFLDEGPEMISSLPIHIDGTCNGIQHLSAMMLDEVGGAAVNLVPDDKPHDIYGDVAEKLQVRLEGIRGAGGAQGECAREWLKITGGSIPRSLTKKPVMTTPYGATREAHFGAVSDWLRENRPGLVFGSTEEADREKRKVLVPWLVKHLEDALSDKVEKAKECMEWLQKVAKVVAATNQPIVWRTPSGFVVRHFYGKEQYLRVKTSIDGKTVKPVIYKRTNNLSEREQLQGIAPNFVHSMDASANTETIIRMALDSKHPPITAIHDAYGTVAGAMWQLFGAVRTAFLWVHSVDVLEEYRRVCVYMLKDCLLADIEADVVSEHEAEDAMRKAERMVPPVPKRGALDINAVAESDYFFA